MSYVGKGPIDRVLGLSQKNTGVGDGSTTSFDILTQAAPQGGDTAVDVFVDNVRQEPGTGKAYVLAADGSGDFKRITFSTAPANGAVIWTNNRLRTQITNILPGSNTITNTLINDSVITAQSALGTSPAATDTFLVYDASASGLKKVAYSDVHSGVADMAANTVKVRDANTTGAPSDKAVVDTQILIGDGTGFTAAALSSDVTMTNAGAVTIANDAVTSAKIINNAVNGAKIAMGSDAAGDILTYTGTDYVRLPKGTAEQQLRINAGATAVEWATVVAGAAWVIKTAAYTAVNGDGVMVDTSSSAITITLPASPVLGNFVRIMDQTGNAATNNITVGRNSEKIQGASADLTIQTARASIGLVYSNTAQGWILIEN